MRPIHWYHIIFFQLPVHQDLMEFQISRWVLAVEPREVYRPLYSSAGTSNGIAETTLRGLLGLEPPQVRALFRIIHLSRLPLHNCRGRAELQRAATRHKYQQSGDKATQRHARYVAIHTLRFSDTLTSEKVYHWFLAWLLSVWYDRHFRQT